VRAAVLDPWRGKIPRGRTLSASRWVAGEVSDVSRLLLIRHCESAGQAPDALLTVDGQEQALKLADKLAAQPIDYVVSSPYLRARATIEPFASRARIPVRVDDRLAERLLSPEPIPHWRRVVELSFEDPHYRVAGGESGAETASRGWAAIHAVLAEGHRLPVVVSHGQLLSLILHSVDKCFGYAGWESLANPDMYLLEVARAGSFSFERFTG
jgi:2,3-bisphosphoglycerate-dependent phosphoglycerate mutase